MYHDEELTRDLEEVGLKVDQDSEGQIRGVLMSREGFIRGYVYPINGGVAWGWVSENLFLNYPMADAIVDCNTRNFRRGREGELVLGRKPMLVIDRFTPTSIDVRFYGGSSPLRLFVSILRVLAFSDPLIRLGTHSGV